MPADDHIQRPYPLQYESEQRLKDGTNVTIRPIRPDDESLMTQFHATLSERSVYMRYFSAMTLSSRVEHERLVRVCFPDYEHGMALVADREDPGTGKHEILGVGRFAGSRDQGEAEAAIIVSDRWQERGLGTQLLRQLVQVAKAEGFNRLTGEVLRDNIAMQRLLKRSGFHFSPLDGATLRAQMDI